MPASRAPEPSVTKADLRRHVVPAVVRFLRRERGVRFHRGTDPAGFRVYTHAAAGGYPATVVFEGAYDWTYDFEEWLEAQPPDVLGDFGTEIYSGLELSVERLYGPLGAR